MRFELAILLGLLTLIICSARPAEDEYPEYDEAEPAPPPKKAPARTPLVGRRNPLAGKNNKASSTTTTTTAAPAKEEEEEAVVEGDYEDEAQPVEPSSTTEASKKLIRPGVGRPFRSNEDLLNSLKKRREQAATNKHSKPVAKAETESAPEPERVTKETPKSTRSSGGRRNRFSKQGDAVEEASSTAAPARSGRRFNNRS